MNGSTGPIEIILAQPRGFCAGVERAIETVRLTLRRYGEPVYVLHEIVHNLHVLNELEQLGAVFVEDLADIPAGGICIFSAMECRGRWSRPRDSSVSRPSMPPAPWSGASTGWSRSIMAKAAMC